MSLYGECHHIAMRIGVDSGGTFTDFVVLHDDGSLDSFKLRSNPASPASVILEGIRRIAAREVRRCRSRFHSRHQRAARTQRREDSVRHHCGLRGSDRHRPAESARTLQSDSRARAGRWFRAISASASSERMLFDGTVETPLADVAALRRTHRRVGRRICRDLSAALLPERLP